MEMKFESLIVKALLIAFLGVVASISTCEMHGQWQMSRLVDAGHSPVAARCAIHGMTTHELLCSQANRAAE